MGLRSIGCRNTGRLMEKAGLIFPLGSPPEGVTGDTKHWLAYGKACVIFSLGVPFASLKRGTGCLTLAGLWYHPARVSKWGPLAF